MSNWKLSGRATWMLMGNKRFWIGPARLGLLIEVMEFIDAEQRRQGR
jgi:hypothetical protein